jgi:hypothetical protein
VIAVFTKHDQFRRNIKIKLEDQRRDSALLDAEVETVFNQQYLASLTGPPPFIRLESKDSHYHRTMYYTNLYPAGMHKSDQRCNGLIELTASTLSGGAVALMLLAVQRDNLELSINQAIRR